MKFNLLKIPDAIKIFNQHFGVEITDFIHLERSLADAGAVWSQIVDWDAFLPAKHILEILNFEKLPGRVLVTTDDTYTARNWQWMRPEQEGSDVVVFELCGEDLEEFIVEHVAHAKSVFFNRGDNLIIWLDVGQIAFIDDEGWYCVFNKAAVLDAIKKYVPMPNYRAAEILARARAKRNQES